MRSTPQTVSNPFGMLTDPQSILDAIERSERLNLLTRRVCRPLDRPMIPKVDGDLVAEFDREIALDADSDTPGAAEAS